MPCPLTPFVPGTAAEVSAVIEWYEYNRAGILARACAGTISKTELLALSAQVHDPELRAVLNKS